MRIKLKFSWRKFNALCAILSGVLWVIATDTGWVNSVKFVSHISMLTMVATFIAAWRTDVPTRKA